MTYKHAATHCNTLQHAAKRCNTLQHSATHCITLQHTATHCSALQHTAAHCNTLQHTARHNILKTKRAPTIFKKRIFGVGVADTCVARIIQHCNSLQHTATCYRTLHFRKTKRALTIFKKRILGVGVADTCVARIRLIALLFEFQDFIFDIRSLCTYQICNVLLYNIESDWSRSFLKLRV